MARALLLNASYEPLSIVTARRAVLLLIKERAETVHRNGATFHSERRDVAVPSVLRLKRYVAVPHRSHVPLTRRAVFARDGHRCQYCAGPAENIDHVQPRSRGGTHVWDNVVACCRRCNARKKDRLLAETDLVLKRRPVAPPPSIGLISGVGSVDPVWRQYLGEVPAELATA